MKLKSLIQASFVFLAFLGAGCPAPCDVTGDEVEQIHNELAPLVQDLEAYKKRRGVYPEKITDMYPLHVTVSERAGNRKLAYHRIDENRYNLRVYSRSGSSYSGSCSAAEIVEKYEESKSSLK